MIYKTLAKYNLIKILPFKNTYYYTETLPKKIELSSDIIKINYLRNSPYSNPKIIYTFENEQLLLWFHKNEINFPIVIPESYIAYKELRKQKKDMIYIINNIDIEVVVIKGGKLLKAFSTKELNDTDIKMIMDECQVYSSEVIDKEKYKSILQRSIKKLTLKDFYNFIQIDKDKRTIVNSVVKHATYPVSVLLILIMLVNYTQSSMLESKIFELKKVYLESKDENKDIKELIKYHNKEVEKWNSFFHNELLYFEPTKILNDIYSIFKGNENSYLKEYFIRENNLILKVETDKDPILYLNRLNKINYFSNIVIQNSFKIRNSEMKVFTYSITVDTVRSM